MYGWQEFTASRTRSELRHTGAVVSATSDGLGWSSAYASLQCEQPFAACLSHIADGVLILHRSGPVDVTVRLGARASELQQRRRGQISFIPGDCGGDLDLHAPHDTLHVYLRSELFAVRTGAPLLGIEDSVLEHLAIAIGQALRDRVPGSALYVDPIAQAMADRILHVAGQSPKPSSISRLSQTQLRRVREFVEANLEDDIRLEAMARASGVGTKTLQRGFKAATGITPYQFVLQRRVEKARELLADRSLSLPEIALRCGFCHQEHLTRMFQRIVGQPPGLYRLGVA